jgi:hypothetical protein
MRKFEIHNKAQLVQYAILKKASGCRKRWDSGKLLPVEVRWPWI